MRLDVNKALRVKMDTLIGKEMKDIKKEEIEDIKRALKIIMGDLSKEVYISNALVGRVHNGIVKQARDLILEFKEFELGTPVIDPIIEEVVVEKAVEEVVDEKVIPKGTTKSKGSKKKKKDK